MMLGFSKANGWCLWKVFSCFLHKHPMKSMRMERGLDGASSWCQCHGHLCRSGKGWRQWLRLQALAFSRAFKRAEGGVSPWVTKKAVSFQGSVARQ